MSTVGKPIVCKAAVGTPRHLIAPQLAALSALSASASPRAWQPLLILLAPLLTCSH